MPETLSQEKLEEMVVGKPGRPNATFFEQAVLDVQASKAAGKRVYRRTVFVKVAQPGVKDFISYEARQADVREFAREWEEFQRTRQGAKRETAVGIVPNLKLEHMQELIDMGLSTVQKLAAAELVPPHLQYAQKSAVALAEVLEAQHGDQEDIEEDIHKHGTGIEENQGQEEIGHHERMFAESGREHERRVAGSDIAPGRGDRTGEAAERLRPGGRTHRRQGVDWSYDFILR